MKWFVNISKWCICKGNFVQLQITIYSHYSRLSIYENGDSHQGRCFLWGCFSIFIWEQLQTSPSTQAVSSWSLVGNTSLATSHDPVLFFPILPRRKWSLCEGQMMCLNFWLESVSSQSWDYSCCKPQPFSFNFNGNSQHLIMWVFVPSSYFFHTGKGI